MTRTVTLTANDGSQVQYVDTGAPMQGGMKDVYFSPDKTYVVAFFRDKFKPAEYTAQKDRLTTITNTYRERIFNQAGGDYWKDLFCWPTKVVEYNGLIGVVAPVYQSKFFFKYGYNPAGAAIASIVGKEKEGKWFAAAQFRNHNFKLHLDDRELGDWFKFILVCIRIARAVRRMHAAGLAHSDLSYKNVLVDPVSGSASIIDIDGLVVPGKFPPDVIGTPDFIAPEVMATKHLPKEDPARKLPSISTDRHALAVMVYMYLLYRHPLRGGKVNDLDAERDEVLSMGEKALFIEHPTDTSNRPRLDQVKPTHLPWADVNKLPYTLCGPHLKALFDKAFINGLHHPAERPTADDWESALLKTVDSLQPCQNPQCAQKWFVFDNSTQPVCPFCGTRYKGQLPILNFYWARKPGAYVPENHRLMVYHNQYLYQWHVNRNITPNERLTDAQKKPVGYFVQHQGNWVLVNQAMPDLKDVTADAAIPIGQMVVLKDNQQLLLSKDEGGHLVIVQLVAN
ncbi:Protein kinase domain-containing protein [Chitinophaga costaii]|uniref:Protein kinase domain-containing protein n=1 Tax=Chitinophaga costaii TaxID=1335309 RepID=A0A1C4APK1_9BACT|nr:lipopolysaccharide kinase InaA family protein [Chitinophaga costaii]PUZ26698.1 kinase [Chitinophaga costaii]SCB96662.1 Protein kinase domain-containing protein [Chitinophaga costaii]